MSIVPREVKNKKNPDGTKSNRTGTVYDVFFRYSHDGIKKTYAQRGFLTRHDAQKHEVEMREQLRNPNRVDIHNFQSRQTVEEYLEDWIEAHGNANLRPSTFASYRSHITNHIIPYVGNIQLRALTPAMLDKMFQELFAKGLSQSTVRYAQRILSVSLEAARKYGYIETNAARNIITKFGKGGKTPDPYTIEQMRLLLNHAIGTQWEMLVMLGGLYGLRLGEIIGLCWRNVDMKNKTFNVCEQMPFRVPTGTKELHEMAPVKSDERILPITDVALPYFQRQLQLIERQRQLCEIDGGTYYDNDIVIPKSDGSPRRQERVSADFGQLLRHLEMPHIRFHDLRHTAATNLHQLTGDFFTISKILGHTMKGVGIQLGISGNLDSTTAQYVEVRIDRKIAVLNAYHNAILPPETKNNIIHFEVV